MKKVRVLKFLFSIILSMFLVLGMLHGYTNAEAAASPTATVSDVTVSGTVGTAIKDTKITITLLEGTFISRQLKQLRLMEFQ